MDPRNPPVINCSSGRFLDESWNIESPKAMKVKSKISKKNLMSLITSMIILIKYPVD